MLPEFEDPKKQITATFELLPQKNNKKTKEAGRPIYDDIEVCVIRFAGNRYTKGVFPAHEVFTRMVNPETGEEEPVTYAMHYNSQYMQFKNGDAQSVSGTPLNVLPLITPGKRLELKALAIHTVETLANIDGQAKKALGMGGNELIAQAKAYLEDASKLTSATDSAAIIEALRAEVAELKAGKAGTIEQKPADDNPFKDWEAEDLINWIAQASPDTQIDKRWGKSTLQARAAEINSKLKAAA